jgi:hypothetical protein
MAAPAAMRTAGGPCDCARRTSRAGPQPRAAAPRRAPSAQLGAATCAPGLASASFHPATPPPPPPIQPLAPPPPPPPPAQGPSSSRSSSRPRASSPKPQRHPARPRRRPCCCRPARRPARSPQTGWSCATPAQAPRASPASLCAQGAASGRRSGSCPRSSCRRAATLSLSTAARVGDVTGAVARCNRSPQGGAVPHPPNPQAKSPGDARRAGGGRGAPRSPHTSLLEAPRRSAVPHRSLPHLRPRPASRQLERRAGGGGPRRRPPAAAAGPEDQQGGGAPDPSRPRRERREHHRRRRHRVSGACGARLLAD